MSLVLSPTVHGNLFWQPQDTDEVPTASILSPIRNSLRGRKKTSFYFMRLIFFRFAVRTFSSLPGPDASRLDPIHNHSGHCSPNAQEHTAEVTVAPTEATTRDRTRPKGQTLDRDNHTGALRQTQVGKKNNWGIKTSPNVPDMAEITHKNK